jgi:hypothetical protein
MGCSYRSDGLRASHRRERAPVMFLGRAALQRPYTFVAVPFLIAPLGPSSITTVFPDIFQRSIFPWSASSRGFAGSFSATYYPGNFRSKIFRRDSNA